MAFFLFLEDTKLPSLAAGGTVGLEQCLLLVHVFYDAHAGISCSSACPCSSKHKKCPCSSACLCSSTFSTMPMTLKRRVAFTCRRRSRFLGNRTCLMEGGEQTCVV